MTVDGLREWLDDGDLFVDDNQEVLFSYNGAVLEIDGTEVPESGPVKVILRPAKQHEVR